MAEQPPKRNAAELARDMSRGPKQPAKPSRKPTRQALDDHAPWMTPAYELADATAVKALAAGTADMEQQKRALAWIINKGAGTYDISYRPGTDGQRDTDFALGRAFVGQQIVKLINVPLSLMRRNDGGSGREHQ